MTPINLNRRGPVIDWQLCVVSAGCSVTALGQNQVPFWPWAWNCATTTLLNWCLMFLHISHTAEVQRNLVSYEVCVIRSEQGRKWEKLTFPGNHLCPDPRQTAQSRGVDLSARTPVPDEDKNILILVQAGWENTLVFTVNKRYSNCTVRTVHPQLQDTSQTCHLVNFVPLGMEALLDRLALEQLVADLQDAVRVGLALDQPAQKFILPLQILSLQEVNPQDPLWRHAERWEEWLWNSSVWHFEATMKSELIRCDITYWVSWANAREDLSLGLDSNKTLKWCNLLFTFYLISYRNSLTN